MTLNDPLQSPKNPALSIIQQKYLEYLLESSSGNLSRVCDFRPDFNELRERLLLAWDAKNPDKVRVFKSKHEKSSIFSRPTTVDFNPFSQMARIGRISLLQGQLRAVKNAGLESALYRLGGIRPFLLIFANSLELGDNFSTTTSQGAFNIIRHKLIF